MSTVDAANAAPGSKTVADAVAEYVSLKPIWDRSRAICSGERYTKTFDSILDVQSFSNLLIPFSPSMTDLQYRFYKAEAELPGIVAQFVKMLVGGLLRKQPVMSLPESLPSEAKDWILNQFGQDDSPLTSVLDEALYEEMQTSRCWIYIDHPALSEDAEATEIAASKPYPIIWKAETVINWRRKVGVTGKAMLDRVITRGYEEATSSVNEFHPNFVDTVRVHEVVSGVYQIRIYQATAPTTNVPVVAGQRQAPSSKPAFTLIETLYPKARGRPIEIIPAWPLNGMVEPPEPMLSPFIDKEVSLYNKISRRNHLLYGASTYTPVISSDMSDEDFENTVNGGLGTWIRLRQGDTASVLETPTAALQDMDRAIASTIEEMAKMGMRMLSPETAQSGVALEIRNASQNAQLGTLNTKVSNTLKQVIAFMCWWRYDVEVTATDVKFELSADFNPTPLGADWLRLATEWYQQGLIPRTVWLQIIKQNDMISPDYDDEAGKVEIMNDMAAVADAQAKAVTNDYANKISGSNNGQ